MQPNPLDRVRTACLSLPESFEQEAWGAPTFRIRKRIFAIYAKGVHGDGRTSMWCNAPMGVQRFLVDTESSRFFVPPYVGVRGWLGVVLERVDDRELAELAAQSYCMVAPKKLAARVAGD